MAGGKKKHKKRSKDKGKEKGIPGSAGVATKDDGRPKRKRKRGTDHEKNESTTAEAEAASDVSDADDRHSPVPPAAKRFKSDRSRKVFDPANDSLSSELTADGDDEPDVAEPETEPSALLAFGLGDDSESSDDGGGGNAASSGYVPVWLRNATLIPDDTYTELSGVPLDEPVKKGLRGADIVSLFPVQTLVVPAIMRNRGRDVCVGAPTGCGKTLAYVIPVVQRLWRRVVPRVRAVAVVPTRELALQVASVFAAVTAETDLRTLTLIGKATFQVEQQELEGGAIDIIVATPGRLVDHIRGTAALNLNHLEFLIVDEMDRLLSQSYQSWLEVVLDHINAATDTPATTGSAVTAPQAAVAGDVHPDPEFESLLSRGSNLSGSGAASAVNRFTTYDALREVVPGSAAGSVGGGGGGGHNPLALPVCTARRRRGQVWEKTLLARPVQKLIFSATLTTNPEQVASLRLLRPMYFTSSTTGKYKLPSTLTEYMTVVEAADKVLVLLYLLFINRRSQVLCFTGSLDASHRLARLLGLIPQVRVAEYTSAITPKARARVIERFERGELQVLVCSDVMARGVDLPHVGVVVNYDAPSHLRTYVHRVGRTARAGRDGKTYTLVEEAGKAHFRRMLTEADHGSVNRLVVRDHEYARFLDDFETALPLLKAVLELESSGELDVSRPLPGDETSAAEAEGIGSVAAAVAGLALANGIEVPRHVADFVGAVGAGPDAAVAADDDSSSDDGADLGGAPPVAVKGRVRHFASSSSSGSGSDSG